METILGKVFKTNRINYTYVVDSDWNYTYYFSHLGKSYQIKKANKTGHYTLCYDNISKVVSRTYLKLKLKKGESLW